METPRLPNAIIMDIIRIAEEEYGSSHWRAHKKEYNRGVLHLVETGRFVFPGTWLVPPRETECNEWRCGDCGAISSLCREECFRCESTRGPDDDDDY
jgi:hypothetical protein